MKVWSQSLKKIRLSITKKWSSYKCNLTKNATNVKIKSEIMIGSLDQSSLLNESLLLAKKRPLSNWMNWSLSFRRNAKISNQVSTKNFYKRERDLLTLWELIKAWVENLTARCRFQKREWNFKRESGLGWVWAW